MSDAIFYSPGVSPDGAGKIAFYGFASDPYMRLAYNNSKIIYEFDLGFPLIGGRIVSKSEVLQVDADMTLALSSDGTTANFTNVISWANTEDNITKYYYGLDNWAGTRKLYLRVRNEETVTSGSYAALHDFYIECWLDTSELYGSFSEQPVLKPGGNHLIVPYHSGGGAFSFRTDFVQEDDLYTLTDQPEFAHSKDIGMERADSVVTKFSVRTATLDGVERIEPYGTKSRSFMIQGRLFGSNADTNMMLLWYWQERKKILYLRTNRDVMRGVLERVFERERHAGIINWQATFRAISNEPPEI